MQINIYGMLVKENSPVKSSLLGNITTFRVTLVVVLVGVEVGTVSYMQARVGFRASSGCGHSDPFTIY